MIYTIVVLAGDHVTDADLASQKENIRRALNECVSDVAVNMFPEFEFGEVQ